MFLKKFTICNKLSTDASVNNLSGTLYNNVSGVMYYNNNLNNNSSTIEAGNILFIESEEGDIINSGNIKGNDVYFGIKRII